MIKEGNKLFIYCESQVNVLNVCSLTDCCICAQVESESLEMSVDGANNTLVVRHYPTFHSTSIFLSCHGLVEELGDYLVNSAKNGVLYDLSYASWQDIEQVVLKLACCGNLALLYMDVESKRLLSNLFYRLWMMRYNYTYKYDLVPRFKMYMDFVQYVAVSYAGCMDVITLYDMDKYEILCKSEHVFHAETFTASLPRFTLGSRDEYFVVPRKDVPVLYVHKKYSGTPEWMKVMIAADNVFVCQCGQVYCIFGEHDALLKAIKEVGEWNGNFINIGEAGEFLQAMCCRDISAKLSYMKRYNIDEKSWQTEFCRLRKMFGVETEEEVIEKLPLLL